MNRLLRELVRRVAPIGWTYDGLTPGGHARMVHTSGAVYYTPATTSDKARGDKNALAEMERIGGQKLPRVRKRRGRQRSMKADLQVEASRRRHLAQFDAVQEQRQAERDAADRIYRAAVRAAADDRRRREIEELMKP